MFQTKEEGVAMRKTVLVLMVLLFVLATGNAWAAVFDVTTEAEFQAALDEASVNGQNDTVNLAAGFYNAVDAGGPGVGFTYIANSTAPKENYALTIVGAGAAQTVLDGGWQGEEPPATGNQILYIYTAALSDGSAAHVSVSGITFQNGNGNYGGGFSAYSISGPVTLTSNTFTGNIAGSHGGGVFTEYDSGAVVTLTGNTFTGNIAGSYGGGVYTFSEGAGVCTMEGNTFTGNSAHSGGGAYAYNHSGTITITNNTLSGNDVTYDGGGAHAASFSGTVTLTNNMFTNNGSDMAGGGAYAASTSNSVTLTGNTFAINNATSDGGGAWVVSYFAMTLTGNTFDKNTSRNGGGVYAEPYGGEATITNNSFTGNSAPDTGGGAYVETNFAGTTSFSGNTLSGNSAGRGGGIAISDYSGSATTNLANNTLSGNTAAIEGGGVYVMSSGTADIYNNIVRGNAAATGGDIFLNGGPSLTATLSYNNYSVFDTLGTFTVNEDASNIDLDPLFVDATAPDPADWDLHLQPDSPCMDAGDNALVPADLTTDRDGQPRILDGDGDGTATVDMGSDEFAYAEISVTPASLAFGDVQELTSSTLQTVTIESAGTGDLTVTDITLGGASPDEFVIGGGGTCGSTPITLLPTESCTVEVAFTPSTTGAMSASLDIASDGGSASLELSGTGTATPVPNLSVTPATVSFADTTEGVSSAPQTVIINSTGTADLTVSSISLSGADAGEFSLDAGDGTGETCGNTPVTLTPTASCTVEVAFTPSTTGAMSASLSIASDGGSASVALSGTGLSSVTNNAPSAPELVTPKDGSTVAATGIVFGWNASTDPDGDTVEYDLYVCDNQDFTGCATPENPTPITASLKGVTYAGAGMGMLLIGMALAGGLSRRRKLALVLAALLMAGMLLAACGGGGGKATVQAGDMTFTAGDMTAGTTYFWKVEATDGTDTTPSGTWSFNTK
jgi:hypothetical protein